METIKKEAGASSFQNISPKEFALVEFGRIFGSMGDLGVTSYEIAKEMVDVSESSSIEVVNQVALIVSNAA